MAFMDAIFDRAKADKKTIVLPESNDVRVLEATAKILERDVANVILVGDETQIKETAGTWDVSGATIIDPKTYERTAEMADAFYELRKNKGMTPEKAVATMDDALYFGVMLVKMGVADGMVAGAANSTAATLRPALQILKTAPGTKLVSAFFLMVVPDESFGANGAFVFGDSGLVENPDANALSEIAISSANSFRQLVQEEPP